MGFMTQMGLVAVSFSCAVCVAAVLGCSTGTGGTGSGGTSSTGIGACQSACDNFASLPCAGTDGGVTGCVSQCEADIASSSPCATQAQTYFDCLSAAHLACDANGIPNITTVCVAESRAYNVCAACLPASTDDACDTCSKSSCCAESKAYFGDPQLFDYSNCLSACSNLVCFNGCDGQYPSVLQNRQTYVNCQNTNCAAACGP